MKIGMLGSGVVGQTISDRLDSLGHEVALGTRDVASLLARTEPAMGQTEPFAVWHRQHPQITLATFAGAAAHGELVFNATAGTASLEALRLAGEAHLNGKVVVDVSNPLDFSRGLPPTLLVANSDSLGEQIQRAFPQVRVVKTLNTVNASLMVDPRQLADGDHHVFVSGNDAQAKTLVTTILTDWFGWRHVLDLGDITTARGPEMYLPLWLRLWGALGVPMFNIKIAT